MDFLKEHWKALTAGTIVGTAALCYYIYTLEEQSEEEEGKATQRLPGGTHFHGKVDINAD